jgi:hypothetical protein
MRLDTYGTSSIAIYWTSTVARPGYERRSRPGGEIRILGRLALTRERPALDERTPGRRVRLDAVRDVSVSDQSERGNERVAIFSAAVRWRASGEEGGSGPTGAAFHF